MTVKELIDLLSQYPDDMEVIETRCSDYGDMKPEYWNVVQARKSFGNEWYERYYSENDWRIVEGAPKPPYQISRGNLHPVKDYLHYSGN